MFGFEEISGIAVDHQHNLLYWALNSTTSSTLSVLNMTAWDNAHRHRAQLVSSYSIV